VIGKIDIHEEGDLLLREAALDHEEAALQRRRAGAADGCEQVVLVVRAQRAEFDFAAIA
jgi:hypothetical protein